MRTQEIHSTTLPGKKWYYISTAPNRDPVLHEYFGKVVDHYFCIQERKDQLSISRAVGDLVLFWRFSMDGRIRNISFKVMKNNIYLSGMRVYKTDALSHWETGFAFYRELPLESASILTRIANLPSLEQYSSLLLKMQGDLTAYLASPPNDDSATRRRPHQLTLQDLSLNNRAYSSLQLAVRLTPKFNVVDQSLARVQYLPEEKALGASSSLFEARHV